MKRTFWKRQGQFPRIKSGIIWAGYGSKRKNMAKDKNKETVQKEVCVQSRWHETGKCLRELQVNSEGPECQPQEKVGHSELEE